MLPDTLSPPRPAPERNSEYERVFVAPRILIADLASSSARKALPLISDLGLYICATSADVDPNREMENGTPSYRPSHPNRHNGAYGRLL